MNENSSSRISENFSDKFLVSVIIPVFNEEKTVEKTINSVLKQNEVGEIIVVEDGSTDKSLEILQRLNKEIHLLKLKKHPHGENRGKAASRNLGIKASMYKFVAFLNCGDIYFPGRFEQDKKILGADSFADVVYSSVSGECLNKNRKLGDIRKKIQDSACCTEFYKFSLSHTSRHPAFHTNSVTIRKKFLLTQKLFDERIELHEDSELWKRLLRKGCFYPGILFEPVANLSKKKLIPKKDSLEARLNMYAVFVDNVGMGNLYDFELNHLVENILRCKSRLYKNNWSRRISYYFEKARLTINKKKYLERFVRNNVRYGS